MSGSRNVTICKIPGNSDIAGIGVRASVYAQACLAGLNLLYMMHSVTYSEKKESLQPSTVQLETVQAASTAVEQRNDPEALSNTSARPPSPSPSSKSTIHVYLSENSDYISMTKALERSLFMIGFAVILSAILEARSDTGLTAYHALIVLNISQINNWAGFLLLLLRGGFRTKGKGWIKRIFVTRKSLMTSILCVVHSSMMSGLGLYFWTNPVHFVEYAAESELQPCQPVVFFWAFGTVNLTNKSLRIASLVFYAISIVPIFGLYFLAIVPGLALLVSFFVALVFAFSVAIPVLLLGVIYFLILKAFAEFVFEPLLRIELVEDVLDSVGGALSPAGDRLIILFRRLRSAIHGLIRMGGPSYAPLITFPVALFFSAPLIYSIVSTELIIRINAANVEEGAESKWTYGQTLALFGALVAITLYANEIIKIVRDRRRRVSMVQDPKRPKYISKDAQTEHID